MHSVVHRHPHRRHVLPQTVRLQPEAGCKAVQRTDGPQGKALLQIKRQHLLGRALRHRPARAMPGQSFLPGGGSLQQGRERFGAAHRRGQKIPICRIAPPYKTAQGCSGSGISIHGQQNAGRIRHTARPAHAPHFAHREHPQHFAAGPVHAAHLAADQLAELLCRESSCLPRARRFTNLDHFGSPIRFRMLSAYRRGTKNARETAPTALFY